MYSSLKTTTAKLAAAVAGGALVLTMAVASFAVPAQAALNESQISSILSLLQSFGADASVVANVEASLRGQTPTGGSNPGTGTTGTSCALFTRDLTVGSTGADVRALQQLLNSLNYTVASSGAGSPGNETETFGPRTQAALASMQAAVGVSPASGYFGPITRAALVSGGFCGTTTTPGGPVGPAPSATSLMVSAGSQPQNALAPKNTSRVPFTRFTVTAPTSGSVTINSVTVQRTGLANNAVFAGVILVDQDGTQLGTAKTFNSNDQATIGEAVTIPAGQTRTFTVAGNMADNLTNFAGQVASIAVVGVNTSAAVSGSLPITGAFHTINQTLSTGDMTLEVSNAFAANTSVSEEIGTTMQRVSGFRLTAGSAEDVRLRMIRFNQTGSASTMNDISNIQIVVGGTAYPVTISPDGKFVTANFGSGILIEEGNNVEVYVQYDIVGGNANGRTIIFDVDENTDIFAEGVTYGYGISPKVDTTNSVPSPRGVTTETNVTPYIAGNQITISGASVTTISKANSVAAQNIAVNVPNQPLGGFQTDIQGEAITVQSLVFSVATSSSSTLGTSGQLTNVTIVNQNGAVVAGPVDSTGSGATRTLTFTDSVTFPTGMHTYTIRGRVPSTASQDAVITLSTTPSSNWTNAKGDITGDTVSLPASIVTMNGMTVKTGSLAVTRAATFTSQTVVSGGIDVEMARFQLDAQQSGEDVRIASFPTSLAFTGAANANVLSSCRFFDGTQVLNSSNVLNPSGTSPTTNTVTFNQPLTVAKGTVKTLSLKCNISSAASNGNTFTWDHGASFSVTGVGSSNSITATLPTDNAATITIGNASLTVTTDASSPGYGHVAAGSTNNIVGALRFTTTNEGVNLQRVGLQLSNTASSTPSDITIVRLFDGATEVGQATFVGNSNFATSTLSSSVLIPANSDKVLTVRADFANVGTSQAVTYSGSFVAINVDTNGGNTRGVGQSSGATVDATGSSAVSGQRVFKSFPTVALGSLNTTGIQDGRLMRFTVTANASGPISLANFNFTIATTTLSVTNVRVYGYTDANYSLPITGVSTDGSLAQNVVNPAGASGAVAIPVQTSGGTATTIQVPAGGTRYFEVRGSVAGATSGASATTILLGDASFPSTGATVNQNPLLAEAGFSGNFEWSPNSTTTSSRLDQDWTNGFGVQGLPSSGLIQTRSQ